MTNLTWKYIFSKVTSWLGASSAAVPPMQFERMVGVDGRYDGVARRYPGHNRYPDSTGALGAVAGNTPPLAYPHLIPFEVNATSGGSDRIVGFVMQDKEQGVELWHRKLSDPPGQMRRSYLWTTRRSYVQHSGSTSSWPLVPALTRGVGPAHVTGAAWHDDGTTDGPVLYVCGVINRAGHISGNAHGGVFRLVGGTWEPVGLPAFEGLPRTLFSYEGQLWLGGGFTKYNGRQCRRLAVWNGTEWIQVGRGVDNGEVFCFAVAPDSFGSNAPKLRAGGSFTAINNGTACDRNLVINAAEGALHAVNTSANFRAVYSMTAMGNALYATGVTTGTSAQTHRTFQLSAHEGIWTSVSTGGSPPNAPIGRALAVFAGRLYLAWGAGARSGLSYYVPSTGTWTTVHTENVRGKVPRALRAVGNTLYMYGDFDTWAGHTSPKIIAVNASGGHSPVSAPYGGYRPDLQNPDRQIAPNVHLDPDSYLWTVPINSPPVLYGLVYDPTLGVIVSTGEGVNFLKSYNVEDGTATPQGALNCNLAHEMAYDGATVYFSRLGDLYRVNISGGVVDASVITPHGYTDVRGVKHVGSDASGRPVYYTARYGGVYHIRKCATDGANDMMIFNTGIAAPLNSLERNGLTGVLYYAQGDSIYHTVWGIPTPVYTLQGSTIHRVRINNTTQIMYWSESFVRAGVTHWRIRAAAIDWGTYAIGTPYTIQWSTTISSFNGMSIDESTNEMYIAVESTNPVLRRISLDVKPSLYAVAAGGGGSIAAVGTVSSPEGIFRWPADGSALVSAASYGSYLYLFSSLGDHRTLSWNNGGNSWWVDIFGPGLTFIPAPVIDVINDGASQLAPGAYKGYLRFVDTNRRRFSALSLASASDFANAYPAYGYLKTPEDWGPGDAAAVWGYRRGEGLRTLSSGSTAVPAGGNIYRFMRGSIGPNSFLNYRFGFSESYDYGNGEAANPTPDADLPVDARRLYDLAREQIGELGRVYAAVQHQGILFTLEADGGFLHIRWTPTTRDEPENFPPLNTYQTMIPESSGETCQFVSGDDFLYLIGGSRIYRIQKAGRVIGIVERYNGHPFVHRQAVVATKSRIYAAALDGLVVVDSTNGAVAPVDAMAKVFRDRWRGTFGVPDSAGRIKRLCLSYDAHLNVIYIHNPQLAETVLVWLNSGQWTMLAGHNVATSASTLDIDTGRGVRSYFLSAHRYLMTPNWLVSQSDPQTMHGLTLYTGQQTVKYNAVPTAVGTGANAYGQTVSYLDFPYNTGSPPPPQTVTIPVGAVDTNPFYDRWFLEAGSDKVSAMTTADGYSSFLTGVYYESIQRYTLATNPVPSNATVTSVRLRVQGRRAGYTDTQVQLVMELGGVQVGVTPPIGLSDSWVTTEVTVTRPGGGLWMPADFNTLKIGVRAYDFAIPAVSLLEVRVTYQPAYTGPPPDYPFSSNGVNVKQVAGMPVVVLEGGLNRTLAFVTSNTGSRLYLDRVIPGLTTAAVALDPVIFEIVGSPLWNLQGRTLDAQRKLIRAVGIAVQKVYSGGPSVHHQTAPVGSSSLLSVGGVRSDELAGVEPITAASDTIVPFRGAAVGPYNQGTSGVKTPTPLDTEKPSNNTVAVNVDGVSLHPSVFCGVSNLAFDVTVMDVIGSLEGTAVAGPGVYP